MIHLLLDERVLCIAPSHPSIEKLLTFEEKKFEKDPEKPPWAPPEVKREKRAAWSEVSPDINTPFFSVLPERPFKVIQTFQGMTDRVMQHCRENGIPFCLHDRRLPFRRPNLQAFRGLRLGQPALLAEFLSKERSGILEAPTRYGKTGLMANTCRAYPGIPTVVTAPGLDLVKQLYEDFKSWLPERDIKLIGAGRKSARYQGPDITVCSIDSLHRCDPGVTELLLIDEPHAIATDDRIAYLDQFHKARRLGFGATPSGRFDGRDCLIEGLIGPVLARRTFQEAVKEGAICNIIVMMIGITVNECTGRQYNTLYKRLLWENPAVAAALQVIDKMLPPDWQRLGFVQTKDSAQFFRQYFPHASVAIASDMTPTERDALKAGMTDGSVKLCFATSIYSQGVTFPDLRVIYNLAGGAPYTSAIQKPGRLAQVRPGKIAGLMFDFEFILPCQNQNQNQVSGPIWQIIRQAGSRRKVYDSKGYQIVTIRTPGQLKEALREHFRLEI